MGGRRKTLAQCQTSREGGGRNNTLKCTDMDFTLWVVFPLECPRQSTPTVGCCIDKNAAKEPHSRLKGAPVWCS